MYYSQLHHDDAAASDAGYDHDAAASDAGYDATPNVKKVSLYYLSTTKENRNAVEPHAHVCFFFFFLEKQTHTTQVCFYLVTYLDFSLMFVLSKNVI